MKRINVAKYKAELEKVEAGLRAAKKKMTQTGYQSDFDWKALYRLKAEATRLYALRTEYRAHPHPITGGWYLHAPTWSNGKTVVADIPVAPQYRMTRLQIMKAVLEGEPGWEKPFIEDYIPPAPVEAPPTA